VNVEMMAFPSGPKIVYDFLKTHNVLWVIDESTCVKNPKAARTKAVLRLAPLAKYRRILSGTPITQGPLDLFSQFQFLKPGSLNFTSFTAFKSYFAITESRHFGPREFKQIVGYRNIEYLKKQLSRVSSRKLKSECLDLPPKLYELVEVDPSPEQVVIYEQLRTAALVQFDQGQVVSAELAITLLGKFLQIACGHIKDDDGIVHRIPGSKAEALNNNLVQLGDKKSIIWCAFKEDVNIIRELLPPGSFVEYHGDTSQEDRQRAIDQFQTNPTVLYFIGNLYTGAKGITLTAAEYVHYYSNTFSLEKREQSEDRAHRIGQTKNVTYIDYVVRRTADKKVMLALKNKKDVASRVLAVVNELLVDTLDS